MSFKFIHLYLKQLFNVMLIIIMNHELNLSLFKYKCKDTYYFHNQFKYDENNKLFVVFLYQNKCQIQILRTFQKIFQKRFWQYEKIGGTTHDFLLKDV